ncbi:MAG: metallophosphoesterase [Bacteroidota bacterium]|nr:metallophosphoesterase [Bacteroidota bacterium]
MKTTMRLPGVFFVMLFLGIFASCDKSDPTDAEIDPFSNGGNERNMIVVISDMHLGADLEYAECKKNLPSLEKMLKRIKASPNVKELVIAGDLLDEWFVPAPINTYQGKDQADFVQRIAATNKGVFDALNSIIREKKILVTYVPGNHDLTITEENINLIVPEINQVRDPELGLGTYYPVGYPEIAIEHGHRYNFFCAPDPISNQEIAPGTILPPGYFFTRIAALYFSQGFPPAADTVPVVTQNASGDESQNLLFAYWKMWDWTLNTFTIENKFDEKIIVTNVDGFTGAYAVNDILPYQTTPGGFIDVNLYHGIQDNWSQRQAHNHVPIDIPAAQAIAGSAIASEMDGQAATQYFLNPDSDVRIVVFGHTHVPTMEASNNHLGQKTIYANSGTWIDHNSLDSSAMNFVVITPQSNDASSQTFVKLYSFKNEVVTEMAVDSLEL